jgi:hypothetical protein
MAYAFCTLLTSDTYLLVPPFRRPLIPSLAATVLTHLLPPFRPGVLALGHALKHLHPKHAHPVPFKLVCLATPATVADRSLALAAEVWDFVVGVEPLEFEGQDAGLGLLGASPLKLSVRLSWAVEVCSLSSSPLGAKGWTSSACALRRGIQQCEMEASSDSGRAGARCRGRPLQGARSPPSPPPAFSCLAEDLLGHLLFGFALRCRKGHRADDPGFLCARALQAGTTSPSSSRSCTSSA